jgi:chaperonin GroES
MFEKPERIRPLGDRALVKRLEAEERTESGLYIPDTAKEKAQLGKVIAVGKGRRDQTGNFMPLDIQEGDTIYFGKYAGTEAGKDYLFIREEDVLGIMQG